MIEMELLRWKDAQFERQVEKKKVENCFNSFNEMSLFEGKFYMLET